MPERSLADFDQRRSLVQELRDPVAAAAVAAEALRWLNHLLGRFRYASEVSEVAGQLAECQNRLPQAIDGMATFLERQLAAGQFRLDGAGDLAESMAAFAVEAEDAMRAVAQAAEALRGAQSAIAHIGNVPEGRDG